MTTLLRRRDDAALERPTMPTMWEPLRELDRIHQELRRYLDRFEQDLVPSLMGEFTPLADLEETDDAFIVEIELPGVAKSDVDVTVEQRRLIVTGERNEKERVGILRRKTRTVGRFRYEVTLPGAIDEEGVRANLEDGILTVHLPKTERTRRRRIPVS